MQAPADAAPDGITTIGTFDPASGAHLDDVNPTSVPDRPRAPKRSGRPIEIMLRSTPSGARVFVNSIDTGQKTPTMWLGETGSEATEFGFSLPQFAYTRYKFWPIQSGVLHARLEPIGRDVDAGVPPAHLVQQPTSITPPETLIVKPDAGVEVSPTPVPLAPTANPLAAPAPNPLVTPTPAPAPGSAAPPASTEPSGSDLVLPY